MMDDNALAIEAGKIAQAALANGMSPDDVPSFISKTLRALRGEDDTAYAVAADTQARVISLAAMIDEMLGGFGWELRDLRKTQLEIVAKLPAGEPLPPPVFRDDDPIGGAEDDAEEAREPVAPPQPAEEPTRLTQDEIAATIGYEKLTCLECGIKFSTLRHHLNRKHQLSAEEYKAKWNLPSDYPMVAEGLAKATADRQRVIMQDRGFAGQRKKVA